MSGEPARASWNMGYERGLIDILLDHNHLKFRGNNGWSPEGWKNIVKKFNEKFPSTGFTKAQIQEKEKELKASYKAIRDAKRTSRIGWNDSMFMINAEPEIWDKLIQVRLSTLPCFDSILVLLCIVFILLIIFHPIG